MQDTEILERVGTVSAPIPGGQAEAVLVEDGEDEEEHLNWSGEYNISVIPNDFNVSTLCNFWDKGVITVPMFQREFVWDKRKASRFIQSIALGLPVPELFLYEAERNNWWVVDGQQRFMSIYFFRKGRFPRPAGAVEIARQMRRGEVLPEEQWKDNRLFSNFALNLSASNGESIAFDGKSYEDLEDRIELKPLRAIVIRQHHPDGDGAAYEIFDRLNTGGVKLSPQQIRLCLFRSPFLDMVDDLNFRREWRTLVGKPPVKDQSDAQIIVRAFAMLEDGGKYSPPMLKFLNSFCKKMRRAPDEKVGFLRELFVGFLGACGNSEDVFQRGNKFRLSLFEAVFTAAMSDCFQKGGVPNRPLDIDAVARLAENKEFEEASQRHSTTTANVQRRLAIAREIIRPL